jgi:hypothetical protein
VREQLISCVNKLEKKSSFLKNQLCRNYKQVETTAVEIGERNVSSSQWNQNLSDKCSIITLIRFSKLNEQVKACQIKSIEIFPKINKLRDILVNKTTTLFSQSFQISGLRQLKTIRNKTSFQPYFQALKPIKKNSYTNA